MIPQRITDYLRERRIRALTKRISEAVRQGRYSDARLIQPEWSAEIAARSIEQIARMEAQLIRRSR